MRIGNVVRAPSGSLWIISAIDDKVVRAVSFDSENCTATQQLEDHEDSRHRYEEYCEEETCQDGCIGHKCMVPVAGWKHSKVEASSVRQFILNGVTKQFGM